MTEIFSNVGERLLLLLKHYNMKQIQLSRKTGLSANAINSYVKGLRIPDTEATYKLSKSLDTTMEWILTGEGEMFPTAESPPSKQQETVWQLKEYQKEAAERCFHGLTEEQVALVNNFEKLIPRDKSEIKLLIEHKITQYALLEDDPSKPQPAGLSSNSQTSKSNTSGATRTA